MYRAGCLIAALGMFAACSPSGGVPAGTPTAPPTTSAAGTGTTPAGGSSAAKAGSPAPGAGAAGMSSGAAGMATTSGAAGMPGAAGSGDSGDGPVPGCSAADATVTGAAAYAAVASVLTAQLPCGVSSCHGGMMPQVGLALFESKDLRTLLVDKPACEAPSLVLVDKTGGDVGLSKSWIWQKLTAPTDKMMNDAVIPQAAWGNPGTTCQSFMGTVMGFGTRMPLGTAKVLAESDLSKIRNWICAGAPGPM